MQKTENQEIIDSLKPDYSRLRFIKISHIDSDKIEVSYRGHEVDGSYVPESSVVPEYIMDLQYSTNREVSFERRESGGFGFDIYHFKIYLKKIVDKDKYKPIGKLLRIKECSYAFIRECGHSWAYLNLLHTTEVPESVGIKIKDNDIYIDNKPIAKIIEYEKKSGFMIHGHNTSKYRTKFNATYDLLIPEIELKDIFFIKGKEIINTYLDEFNSKLVCIDFYLSYIGDYGVVLIVCFNDKSKNFSTGNHWVIPSKDTIKKIIE